MRFTFFVPHDLVSLTELVVLGIPLASFVDQQIDLTSDYGATGEQYNNHSESDIGGLFSATAGEVTAFDVSSVFSALAAGDRCGVLFDHKGIGTTIHYIGIRLRYS